MMKRNRIRTITAVDPGSRNMNVVKYNIENDIGVAAAWIDLQGKNMSKITAKQMRERLIGVFNELPWLFDSDEILVEKQNKLSRACHKIQKTYKKHFKGKCKVVCPKKTKEGVLEKLSKVPREYTSIKTGKTVTYMWAKKNTYKDVMAYGEKKKASVILGTMMLKGKERSMLSGIKRKRSEFAKEVKDHDSIYIKRKSCNRKKPRRIKTRCDDFFDCMIIALDYASDLTGRNLFEKRLNYSPSSNSVNK